MSTTEVRPVTWFEIGSHEADATKKFYGDVFGWTFATERTDGFEYTMVTTGGGINGGILTLPATAPTYAMFYVEVDDVASTCQNVGSAGGKVVVEPVATPEGLVFAHVLDPHGNVFGLFSPPKGG